MKSGIRRRPRIIICPDCGRRMNLIDCGVEEHRRTRTRREQIDGRCPGRVYAHEGFGGIDCPEPGEQPIF
jgi:ribosomal protein L34E